MKPKIKENKFYTTKDGKLFFVESIENNTAHGFFVVRLGVGS